MPAVFPDWKKSGYPWKEKQSHGIRGFCYIHLYGRNRTGLYYHCKQNERLQPIFDKAKTAEWCICNTVISDDYPEAFSNVEAYSTGYIIYSADKKIDLENY